VMGPDGGPVRLSRTLPDTPVAAPVRIVHVGEGNFHRAHQAWYTSHAPDADEWGIAGFTGRRPVASRTPICGTSSPASPLTARPSSWYAPSQRFARSEPAGRIPVGCATTLAAWVLHLRGAGAPVKDPGATSAQQAANSGELPTAVPAVLDTLEPDLGQDEDFVRAVLAQAEALTTRFVHGR